MKTEYYSLRSQTTGELLYVHSSDNSGADFCNERTHYLDYTGDSIYKSKSYSNALYASLYSTDWYNSTEEKPNWCNRKLAEDTILVVEVVETIEVEDVTPIYNMAPPYLDDLDFVRDYHSLFDLQRTKDRHKTVFFMKGRKTDKSDFMLDCCIFRDSHIERIVEFPELPSKIITDKFFRDNPNAFIFVTEPVVVHLMEQRNNVYR